MSSESANEPACNRVECNMMQQEVTGRSGNVNRIRYYAGLWSHSSQDPTASSPTGSLSTSTDGENICYQLHMTHPWQTVA